MGVYLNQVVRCAVALNGALAINWRLMLVHCVSIVIKYFLSVNFCVGK
ncbi:protein of unknown function [Candidatus Nitrotoga arctica]|uniref:Uncharacterized protein n=1 Tax=Candidatus Nitrotoga arctica TaxID=453162 RepID=A0ABN8AJU6_9PROT|nr:protein of unknown function [Candidatus Nitrotoga arctica]